MNTVFYGELRQRCNEIKDGDPMVDKVLDAYDCILDFQKISRTEGLLSLEEACENLDMNDVTQSFFKYLITLVVDVTEPDIIEEMGMNKYFSSDLTGVDGLVSLMYFRACLLIQAGYNAHLVEEYMKSLMPRVYIESLNKRDMNNTLSKEENRASEDKKRFLEWCTDDKEIRESDYSIVNQTARALLMLDDRDLQSLLRDTSHVNLAIAMKGFPGKARKQVFDNLSANSQISLVRDMDYMGPVHVRDIEQCCAELLESIVKRNTRGDFSPNDFSVMKVVLDMYKVKDKSSLTGKKRRTTAVNEQFKAIEIVFENLDYVRIPANNIGAVSLDGITVSISRGACNAILRHFKVETAYLQIMNSYKCNWEKPDENTYIYEEFGKRISENDIAYFRIHYMNDTCEDFYVPWEDCAANEYRNRLQHVTQDEDSNFIIEIGKGGK